MGFGGGKGAVPHSGIKATASGVHFTTSVYGQVIPVIYGCTRIAGRLVWAGNFQSHTQNIGGGSGKKGGGGK
jgi:hypothetical protein